MRTLFVVPPLLGNKNGLPCGRDQFPYISNSLHGIANKIKELGFECTRSAQYRLFYKLVLCFCYEKKQLSSKKTILKTKASDGSWVFGKSQPLTENNNKT